MTIGAERNTENAAPLGLWLSDFRAENGRIFVKATGIWLVNEWQL